MITASSKKKIVETSNSRHIKIYKDYILTDLAKLKKLFVSPVTMLDDPVKDESSLMKMEATNKIWEGVYGLRKYYHII